MIQTFNLNNKTVLITGGYGYLGKAITESLLYHGAIVYVLGRNEDKFLEIFKMNENLNTKLFFYLCDISNTKSIKKAFGAVNKRSKGIDILINNAFFSKGQSPEHLTDKEWQIGIDGTLSSVFRCIREIIPFFKSNKRGKIINVSSMYGIIAPQFEIYKKFPHFLNPPHYGAGKAAIIQLSRYYASFLGGLNINVNCVSPGPFPSSIVQEDISFIEQLKSKTMLNRIGYPEDLAGIFIFLASNASDFVTGQNFIIDGGWTSQ
jgi:NAD(P)-dependent dehydrogenase (short-subunit alcohol dehydrogenase family)